MFVDRVSPLSGIRSLSDQDIIVGSMCIALIMAEQYSICRALLYLNRCMTCTNTHSRRDNLCLSISPSADSCDIILSNTQARPNFSCVIFLDPYDRRNTLHLCLILKC